MFGRPDRPAAHTTRIRERLSALGSDMLRQRAQASERELFNLGITFTLYSGGMSVDRILPFDIIPRVLSPADWKTIDAGVIQRIAALNHFLWDVYHDRKVLADGVVPSELVLQNRNYRPEMVGVDVPRGTYIHICGTDIVRDQNGRFLVLEDNARTPSGVSYVIENRRLMLRVLPEVTHGTRLRAVGDYGRRLAEAMLEIAPPGVSDPQVVLLSPGVFNSAYFEHVFLAREMGVPLVEGSDLLVDENDQVYMKTTAGRARVDVIYRRLNDDFLDPEAFRPESMLGVRGLMRAYRAGKVAVANAVGTGAADDKAVYAYLPRLIKYYLDQEPILDNVETYICREKDGLQFTLDHLEELVVKPVNEAGGYGITVGPRATKEQLEACRKKLLAEPETYISQPTIGLSVCPTLIGDRAVPRHVDLRPFAVTGDSTWVLPGGLTRVALPEGSLVVNSSQGGGSKDTWVLE
ncbi:MAG TPA: circularly permuted type 2 ATP-grasp protein [Kiloniellales bacterium]|nr:circularly permuted type 2 ATP-grasp protein [Kiloniellales bacterium]